jgi:lipoprotein signal peptidase
MNPDIGAGAAVLDLLRETTRSRPQWMVALLFAAVVVADQATKWWVGPESGPRRRNQLRRRPSRRIHTR